MPQNCSAALNFEFSFVVAIPSEGENFQAAVGLRPGICKSRVFNLLSQQQQHKNAKEPETGRNPFCHLSSPRYTFPREDSGCEWVACIQARLILASRSSTHCHLNVQQKGKKTSGFGFSFESWNFPAQKPQCHTVSCSTEKNAILRFAGKLLFFGAIVSQGLNSAKLRGNHIHFDSILLTIMKRENKHNMND